MANDVPVIALFSASHQQESFSDALFTLLPFIMPFRECLCLWLTYLWVLFVTLQNSVTSVHSVLSTEPFLKEVSKENVHLLDSSWKKYRLCHYIPFSAPQKHTSAAVLRRLKVLSPSTERHFALKSDHVTYLKCAIIKQP